MMKLIAISRTGTKCSCCHTRSAHYNINFIFFCIIVSLQTFSFATSSIPRSTNTRHSSSLSSDNNINNPPWNKSPSINPDGFLTNFYKRIQGDWEPEANIGGKYAQLNDRVYIRQVPGDGNCLFHSITVAMALIVNATHVDMVGSSSFTSSSQSRMITKQIRFQNKNTNFEKEKTQYIHTHDKKHKKRCHNTNNKKNENHHSYNHDLNHLYQHSQYLRDKAVEVLSNNPRRLLFLQGNEYLRARDLVNAAAAQYDLTGEEYCELMKQESYWGGGPEIVALCNYLKRPIHVYELCEDQQQKEEHKEEEEEEHDDTAAKGMNEGAKGFNTAKEDNESTDKSISYKKEIFIGPQQKKNHNFCHIDNSKGKLSTNTQFQLRRMACFGSPKFDKRQAIHILSADSRFPDVEPGEQLTSGNHFMALFPEDFIEALNNQQKKLRRKKKSARIRGGGESTILRQSLEKGNRDGRKNTKEKKTSIHHGNVGMKKERNPHWRIMRLCQVIVRWILCI